MSPEEHQEKWMLADAEVRKGLPPGVRLVRTLRGHTDWIGRIAWSPDGQVLATPSSDSTVRLWDGGTGSCLETLDGGGTLTKDVAFDPTSAHVAFAGGKSTGVWDHSGGWTLRSVDTGWVWGILFDGRTNLISIGRDGHAMVWDRKSLRKLDRINLNVGQVYCAAASLEAGRWGAGGDKGIVLCDEASPQASRIRVPVPVAVNSIAFSRSGRWLLTGHLDGIIHVWDTADLRQLRALEGHTRQVGGLSCSHDDRLMASRSTDGTVRLWDVERGSTVATLLEEAGTTWPPGLAFHPHRPLLAVVGSDPGTPEVERNRLVRLYEIDFDVLLGQPKPPPVYYASAKIVLVGDSGVGKTGLGWRLVHGEFKEHASTHGQQFWRLDPLCGQRADGAQCEAVLWDLAGQPDYRLINSLFLDDADLALVLFDPTRNDEPLAGVEFWLRQLEIGRTGDGDVPALLVAARADRGDPRLTRDELDAFCQQRGIRAYHVTSAANGNGIDGLMARMAELIPWDTKVATVTTETFRDIKSFVLALKQDARTDEAVMTPAELRQRLEAAGVTAFTDEQMLAAVGHLATHGYVSRLKTSGGEPRLLLAPEVLNNLAASFVLEARRNPKGLGSLEEQRLLAADYRFPELESLEPADQSVLLDSAASLFLDHNVCFRETDPLLGRAYLVFPELINLKRPVEADAKPLEEGVSYTVAGAVANVYASLVVLMGYTQTFTRTNQWHHHARYEVGNGQVCGFRLEAERPGELDFVLYYGADTDPPVRSLFQSLFESFLARRNLTVYRFEPVVCQKGHPLNRAVVRDHLAQKETSAFCNRCGDRLTLPDATEPIHLTKSQAEAVEADRRAADSRSRFEQVLFRLKIYATEQKLPLPECFVSYAWGDPEHERWVEKRLATDLQKAGVRVVLDRWENARIGASVPRFVERVAQAEWIVVVGTPNYRHKYDNRESLGGFVVAAEGDLIGQRMLGTEEQKASVLPVLREGAKQAALPDLLHPRVHADFRKNEGYVDTALSLLLTLYRLDPQDPLSVDLRESLAPDSAWRGHRHE